MDLDFFGLHVFDDCCGGNGWGDGYAAIFGDGDGDNHGDGYSYGDDYGYADDCGDTEIWDGL